MLQLDFQNRLVSFLVKLLGLMESDDWCFVSQAQLLNLAHYLNHQLHHHNHLRVKNLQFGLENMGEAQ